MAKNKKAKHDLPGSVYKNKNRYWWKVQLPGEDSIKARPLKPVGSSMAATDYNVAVECAKMLLAKAVFASQQSSSDRIQIIADLCKAYMQHANEYYRTGFQIGKEAKQIEYSIKPLIDFCANLPIEEFGPLKLMEIREHMIESGWSRKLINQRIGRLKRMFKWAVSMQYVSPMVYQAISTVEGLKRGRTDAREGTKVRPVDEKYVYKVFGYTTPVIATMIELQLITGMRPGELVQMKPKEIDRSGEVWHYYPEKHKNEFRGHERIVPIGPRGQEILRPYLVRNRDSYCFSPAESESYRRENLTKNRRTPICCGNTVGSNRKSDPRRQSGDHYDTQGFGKAVRRAIAAARRDIKARGGDPDVELPKWTPYQLRHTAATRTRKIFNYETAGALLGHSNMSATAIYAERNQGLADEVAKRLG